MSARKTEWPPPRRKWFPGYTAHRDGWVRSYKNVTLFCGGKKATREQVEEGFAKKKKLISTVASPGFGSDGVDKTYREVLGEFLAMNKARIGAKRKSIQPRTYNNYVVTLNNFGAFEHGGQAIADMYLSDIGPAVFTAYANTMSGWKASGFDSVVCLVGALFRWAVEMEYIEKFRTGPDFVRPDKKQMRDERIANQFSLSVEDIAKSYVAANDTMKCWIALGVCAAFINSDIAHVTRSVVDLKAGVIDFRRRKTGKVRRVIPLPDDVAKMLNEYHRPDAIDPEDADLFFVTENGFPYSRTRNNNGNPSCTISRMTAELLTAADVKRPGVNFKSFRTSFFNLAPRGEWEMERKIIMGRAQGTVDLDSYLEDVGLDRLKHVVNHVWGPVKAEIEKQISNARQDAKASQKMSASAAEPVVACAVESAV